MIMQKNVNSFCRFVFLLLLCFLIKIEREQNKHILDQSSIIMKKYLLSSLVMICACSGVANAGIEVTAVNVNQPANDTLLFALPVDVNVYQDIQNYPDANPGQRMMKFQPEYLVTAKDFTMGDTNVGTATLPANAKVIGLGLDGYDVASDMTSRGIFLEVTAWCRNIPSTKMSLDYLDLFDGYSQYLPEGDLFTDTVADRGYRNHPGYICTFDSEATAENPGSIVDIPFNNPDEDGIYTPFWYKGENIYLTLWMCNWEDVHMKYRYMAFDNAEARMASLMRSGNYCFNNDTYEVIAEYFGTQLMYELPDHRLPAFRTPYFTNDIRVKCNREAVIELKDADGNVVTPAEDGNYYSLDHTQTYVLVVDDRTSEEITFDGITCDIDVNITKEVSAVDELNTNKSIASVRYFNISGQEMQEANGMTIVVTTYTDGSTSTAKVIR